MDSPARVVISDDLPTDGYLFDDVDPAAIEEEPRFSVGELAKVFFGRSSHWIRWNERKGRLILDGEPVGASRSKSGARTYSLVDVERMAHALAMNGGITGEQLLNALRIVQVQGRIYGHLAPEFEVYEEESGAQCPDCRQVFSSSDALVTHLIGEHSHRKTQVA
jgi:hypothetical protein